MIDIPSKEGKDTTLIIESVQLGPGIIEETGPFIVVPVHLTGEGVANRGLKRWEQIYDPDEVDGVHSFEGVPIFRGHVFSKADSTESLGKLQKVRADTVKKRADCEARLVRNRLTGKELAALREGKSIAGSIGYRSKQIFHPEAKKWDDGSDYDWEVRKPFFGDHYAMLGEGDEPACKVCGFNPKESETATEDPDMLVLEDGDIKRRPRGKAKIQQEEDDLMAIDSAELKKLFKESFDESVGPLVKRVEALEQHKESAKPLAEDPTIKTLIETVKQIYESLPDIKAFKEQQEASRLAVQRESFAKQLAAAYTKDGKPEGEAFEKAWEAANKDPLGRDHWLGEHAEVRLQAARETQFRGKILGGEGAEFDLAMEQKKLFGY